MTNRISLKNWEITGVIATLVIVLTVPIYALKRTTLAGRLETMAQGPKVTFVGRDKCAECHKKEYEAWQNSHHDLAMDVADDKTVLVALTAQGSCPTTSALNLNILFLNRSCITCFSQLNCR